MLLNITELSDQPIHEQISLQFLQEMLEGELHDGILLSSPGQFARRHKVSRQTVKRVYQSLERMGVVKHRNGSGYFVHKPDNRSIQQLMDQLHAGKNEFEHELLLAREIQSALLPGTLPRSGSFSVAAFTAPSRVVGGDFYDCFQIAGNKYGFMIADASGHGLPAALIISQIQAIIKTSISRSEDLTGLANLLNRHLKENTSARNFVTLFYGIFNADSGRLDFVNAGHNLPICLRADLTLNYLETTAPALGLTTNFECRIESVIIGRGETVLFYTDGIIEAMNKEEIEFGEKQLTEILFRNHHLNPDSLNTIIRQELERFCTGTVPEDDRTVMILKRN